MKTRKPLSMVLVLALLLVSLVSIAVPTQAVDYNAMIVQGNTSDVRDCKVVFENLMNVPNGNGYWLNNVGWHYNNGSSYHNYTKWKQGYSNDPEYALAQKQSLIDAGAYDVLYWSGHGGTNPSRLNVHPSGSDFGPGANQQPTVYVADTLNVKGNNWAQSCKWNKNSNLKVAIFSACQVLDNTYGDCKYLARAMKASNVRVIAGYHVVSPAHPTDIRIAEDFFYNTQNGGVTGGESIRSSWQTANELNSAASKWAVLCYKENGNQYYRIPGFPGKTYPTPSANAGIYRYWSQYKNPSGGQPIPAAASLGSSVPVTITVAPQIAQYADGASESGLVQYREMNDNAINVDETQQHTVASQYVPEVCKNGLEMVGTVYCQEVNEDVGAVSGTESIIGNTFCYNNQYNGIRLEGDFYKVGVDADGVYMIVDRWREITGESEETVDLSQSTYSSASNDAELVYVPVNATTYKLCYAVTSDELPIQYVDYTTGEPVEMYIA